MTLALFGGKQSITTQIARFNAIDVAERGAVDSVLRGGILSGFLGGIERGGNLVQRLEDLWSARFGVHHAIACNSATSGLLAAAVAAELGPGDSFVVPALTMSATAAAPAFLGAKPLFCDVEGETFCASKWSLGGKMPKAAFITNLFGHPAQLENARKLSAKLDMLMIEDAAQSPLAAENGKLAGTVGHIGVFSFNVHKHLQCGEGGMIVTNDSKLAHKMRHFINHGELAGHGLGLNLRLTEYAAAIVISQMKKADDIIASRITQAEKLNAVANQFSWLTPPKVRTGCKHVYYVWAYLFNAKELGIHRNAFNRALRCEGFPVSDGYVEPIYRLWAFSKMPGNPCPTSEELHDTTLSYFENCGWSLTDEQIDQFGDALKKIERNIGKLKS